MDKHKTDEEFKCYSGCIKCCTDSGKPVELTLPDVIRLNKRLGLKPGEILKKYGEITWQLIPLTHTFIPSLALKMPCRFLKEGICSIYPIRPLYCRLFPEGMAVEDEGSMEDVKGLGYTCVDKGISVSGPRTEFIQELLGMAEEELDETVEFFQNQNYLVDLTDDEFGALSEQLENVSTSEFSGKRNMLVKKMIEGNLGGDINKEFLKKLKKIKEY